ncbi:translation initiation factor IF-3, mitochondrial [Eublepharis macularius]|uniref:Translation initiation factor IF-3, mitochondrial n=1 Tax=Eublepharis macularius TaxID=481883 RepID=A0AA97J398_EUBMA|nr:translation initiation factor IF-3, mitochondrial [Eublepharis macularius]XP_054830587.1 translation initiation factor IF-3, mitochondrial [Eublepharis macularius]
MTALCLKKLMGQAIRNETNFITRCFASFWPQPVHTTVISYTWLELEHSKRGFISVLTKAFCTYEDDKEKVKGKKVNPNARKTIRSVGRKIPYRLIHIIDENGEDQGTMHRADAIQIMNERGVKLVLLKETADPPLYRLMSGQQIKEERLKLRDKQKASSKNGLVQQKELTFTTVIAQHDLDIKIKQIQKWIEKKHNIKVTVQQKKIADGPEKMLELFERILETMPGKATYLSPPRIRKEGRSMCIYRHMSEKEIQTYKRTEKEKNTEKDNERKTTESGLLKQ